uniref:DUF3576 domain-containing protein n=1 Tax=Magnetococcus massalia (strain MO-1) TaxID=451514 RepID=A0A1S7LP96_MAGMO|nr:conserved exported protein of unknown function. putative lipoprotein. Similar to protein Mmc1_3748 from MC-1 [Candidatus Magnetococcus massalia]
MFGRFAVLLLVALSLGMSGCSKGFWTSSNKTDKHELAKFGQKKVVEDAKEEGAFAFDSTMSEPGEKGLFSFGEKDGILAGMGGGGGGKTDGDVRREKLFSGALKVVMELPVRVADGAGGFIATDWKIDPKQPDLRYRLNIHVTGVKPYGTVRVVVLKQRRGLNGWVDREADAQLAKQIAKAIRKSSEPTIKAP